MAAVILGGMYVSSGLPRESDWLAAAMQIGILVAVAFSGCRLAVSATGTGTLLLLAYVARPSTDITFSALGGYVILVAALADRRRLFALLWSAVYLILMGMHQTVSATTWHTWRDLMGNFVLLAVVFTIVGEVVGVSRQRRRARSVREAQKVRRTLQSAARAMHDSIAQSAAQALWLTREARQELDDGSSHEALLVAENACERVVDQTREMMASLQQGRDIMSSSADHAEQVRCVLESQARQLGRSGRVVVWECDLPPQASAEVISGLSAVAVEATRNMVKHGGEQGEYECSIRWDRAAGVVRGAFSNPVDVPGGRAISTGLGLVIMADEVRALGGMISTGTRDGRWIVEFSIPVGDDDA